MTLVAESLRLWTPMALESNYDDLNSWLRHLVSNLCFYDECASLYLQALLASSSFGQVLFQPCEFPALGDVKCEKVPNTVNKSMLASIGEMVVDKMIDESSLMEFCENAMSFVYNSLAAHAPHVQVDEHLNKLSPRVMSNMRTREAIAAILTALGDMGEVLPSDADVLDDWVAKKNAGKQEGSFLCIALNLSSMIKEFESLKFARDTQTFTAEMLEDDIKLNTTDGESEEKLIASWSKTIRIPEFILALECLDNMQSRLLGVMQLAIDKLATSLPINAILFHGAPGSVDLSSTLPANLGLFYNREMMQEPIKQVAKVFCVTAKKEYTWPAEGLLDMIRQLSSVWPAECIDVALGEVRDSRPRRPHDGP